MLMLVLVLFSVELQLVVELIVNFKRVFFGCFLFLKLVKVFA